MRAMSAPHIADDGDGADADGDGVGDACDPRPNTPGDHIAFFEGFYAPVAWTPVIGAATWTVSGGVVAQPATDTDYQLVREGTPDLDNVFVQARVKVDQTSGSILVQKDVGVVLGFQTKPRFYFCGLRPAIIDSEVDAGKLSPGFLGDNFDYAAAAFADALPGAWANLTARTTRAAGQPTTIDCTVTRDAITGSATHQLDAPAAAPSAFAPVAHRRASTTCSWCRSRHPERVLSPRAHATPRSRRPHHAHRRRCSADRRAASRLRRAG